MTHRYVNRTSEIILPHIKLPIPIRHIPRRSLSVYLDCELSVPLGLNEPEIQRFFIDTVSRGDTVFDIGGHIGLYTMLATSADESEIHVFEPHPENIERLEQNVSRNQLKDRVKVVPSVISDSNGEVELFLEGSTTHSIVSDSGESITVNSITLDSYCDDENTIPDLIKVDVEGAGDLVVEGATEVLSHHPDWLVEIHSDSEETAFREKFNSYGYTVQRLDGNHWFATVE